MSDNPPTTGRILGMRNGELRAVLLLISGVMNCVVYGPVGLSAPLLLCVLWLTELGAFHE